MGGGEGVVPGNLVLSSALKTTANIWETVSSNFRKHNKLKVWAFKGPNFSGYRFHVETQLSGYWVTL